jgi:hypothetical protein
MGSLPTPLYRDERVGLYGEDRIIVAVWDDAPQLAQMEALAKYGRAFESEKGPTALLNIAADGRPDFPDDVRRIATDLTRDPTLFQVARAHVILMSGFTGVAVRAFINTFLLIGKPPKPTRMLSTVNAASEWLPQFIEDPRWTANEIERFGNALVASHQR